MYDVFFIIKWVDKIVLLEVCVWVGFISLLYLYTKHISISKRVPTMYISLSRIEELENTKMKLQARLAECEGTVENLNNKLISLEKSKAQLQANKHVLYI